MAVDPRARLATLGGWLREVIARVGRAASDSRLDRATASYLALGGTAGVAVFLIAVFVFPYHSVNHDEGVYLMQASMLLEGQLTLSAGEFAAVLDEEPRPEHVGQLAGRQRELALKQHRRLHEVDALVVVHRVVREDEDGDEKHSEPRGRTECEVAGGSRINSVAESVDANPAAERGEAVGTLSERPTERRQSGTRVGGHF